MSNDPQRGQAAAPDGNDQPKRKPRPRVIGEDPLLTVAEVGWMLGLKKTTAYNLVTNGSIPRAKFGGAVRIWFSDVQRYAVQNTSRPV